MEAEVEIKTERVDDIPLLMWQQRVMGIPQIIDKQLKINGNRQGLSVGWTVACWLSFIVSKADHRMSYVEPWAAEHIEILSRLVPMEVNVQDFTDDRLGDVLRYLSDDESWSTIEQEIGQHLVQVYELPTERVRLDSTSVAVYQEADRETLFAYGHSKDHRPDLSQFKVMLSGLDPMGMPLSTQVVRGNEADDGLYLPAIEQVRKVLKRKGLLYIGDSKMEALCTRAHLAAGNDCYLVPLSKKGKQAELLSELLAPVWSKAQELVEIEATDADSGKSRLVARAYETTRSQRDIVNDKVVDWTERLLVTYSPTLGEQAKRGLDQRLKRAQKKLAELTPASGRGKKKWTKIGPLEVAVEKILKQHRVSDFLQLSYRSHETERHIRRYKERPARIEVSTRYTIDVLVDEDALAKERRTLGWRLFVTNSSQDELPLAQALLTYRQAPVFERDFSRLKGAPLGLRPVYLHREDHIIGLVRLLSLALRLLTLVEFIVRQELQQSQLPLPGLYPGNPKQETLRPTTERLLRAFHNLTLTFIRHGEQELLHLTPLSQLQSRILSLIRLPDSIYTDLTKPLDPIPI